MNFRKLFTAFAFVCAGVSSAQTVSAPLTLDPAVRYGVLENGLTYYIRKNNYPEKQAEFLYCSEGRFNTGGRRAARTGTLPGAHVL